MRALPQISASDQRRIADWVQAQVDKLVALPPEGRQAGAASLRKSLKAQFDNPANSAPFKGQLAAQTAQVAAAKLVDAKTDRWVGFALGRALVDFNHIEGLPGLLAGLTSPEESVRFLTAEGLALVRTALAADKAKLAQVVAALRQAGGAETSAVVLSRIYMALANPADLSGAFDAYVAIFEKRLAFRRGTVVAADGAEVEAYEFLRTPAVLSALNQPQKEQLVRLLAVFLRLDAERYATAGLAFSEIDRLERLLEGGESLLAEIVGAGKGGKARDEIAAGGYDNRAQVLSEAHKWTGSPGGSEPGALNAAPWNVAMGAP
jgi:hypothetical protein